VSYRVAVDIGGTFTDLVVVDEGAKRTTSGKVLSTPANPAEGVLAGLTQVVTDPTAISFFVHGTTVGLNAFLERKGTRVLLIMTAGLRDAYTIARHDRKELYALQYRKPDRLVPRRDVLEVGERLHWDGSIDTPLDESSLRPIVERIRAEGIKAVAVCLVHSYVNPVHELRVREVLLRQCPGLSVTLSHEIAREWREYERASSAVLNAYIAPQVERYLLTLEQELVRLGIEAPLYVMQSNGGVMTAARAREQPIQTLLSGPVGGAIGGAATSRGAPPSVRGAGAAAGAMGGVALSRAIGRGNLFCVDMGGTSFDLSLIVDGQPTVSTETELQGLPVLMSLVDIHTIGAGGGSLAWLEAGGLRVGPQSAGADPGPACYGLGGTEPTVTDANLHLGRLNPEYFLGGRMALDKEAAELALHSIASQVGLDDTAFAEGVLAIINAKMADAMRTITVGQGIDPRDFSLVAFGGAGPMHAVWLAEELEIPEVIVPWSPGTFSAWGMLQTDMRHDIVQTFFEPLAGLDGSAVGAAFDRLEQEGSTRLDEEGIAPDDRYYVRTADMRYVGQEYSVSVPVGREVALDEIEHAFHDAHRVRYGHSTPDAPVEFVNVRVAALGRVGASPAPPVAPGGEEDAVLGTRSVVFNGRVHETPVLRRDRLGPGTRRDAPLVVEEESATTVIPPGARMRVDEHGNLLIATR
jgi:N-methylhydantoinase A